MDTHNSKTTRISLQFGYVYGQYTHKSKMTYTQSSVILNEQLSCIIIPKGVNKYTQLIILAIVWL